MKVRTLAQFLETYRGSSFPTRSRMDDGGILVVKLRGAGNGSMSLLHEYLVNRIAAVAGLPVSDAAVVEMAEGFPWNYGTDEFYDLVRRSAGPNLGLAWIEAATPVAAAAYNQLPTELVSQIVTLDLAFANLDRAAANGNLLLDRNGRHWIVDHGSCCFLARPKGAPGTELPPHHAFAGWEASFDRRWLEGVSPAAIDAMVADVPEIWLRETQLDRAEVRERTHTAVRGK